MSKASGHLPNTLVIGGMKCGTTSLHFYMRLHPEIFMSLDKELGYFHPKYSWDKGLDWYKAKFPEMYPVMGEASPEYTHNPIEYGVPKRIHDTIPDAKLIYMARDPIARAISHYAHDYAERTIDAPFGAIFDNPTKEKSIIARSFHYDTLSPYFEYFSKDQIIVLCSERLFSHRKETMAELFSFLGVDPTFESILFKRTLHTVKWKRRLSPAGVRLSRTRPILRLRYLEHPIRWHILRAIYWWFSAPARTPEINDVQRRRLTDMLKDDVKQFRSWTGKSFEEWSL